MPQRWPLRLALVSATLLAGCIPDAPAAPAGAAPVTGPRPPRPPAGALRRGMNVGNALDAPTEGAWGRVLAPPLFEAIAAAGFDHVRIPVRFSAHAAASAPYTLDEDFLRRVDWAVDQAISRGMTAIVDLHHYNELMEQPDAHAARFVALWKQIAARYAGRPASVVYELLNEPSGKLAPDRWNALLAEALRAIRAADPDRTVVVDSYFWAAAKELDTTLALPPDDRKLVGSFHMYQPILFTHQGMTSWMPPEYGTVGIVFPGPPKAPVQPVAEATKVGWVADWFQRYNTLPAETNPGGHATLKEEFEHARAFADRTKLPVYMGEFGAADRADMASRVTWTRAVRKEAERRGIGWAYWDDGGAFKVYDPKTGQWNAELLAALMD